MPSSLQDVRKNIEDILGKIEDVEKTIESARSSDSKETEDVEALKNALNAYIERLKHLYTTASETVTLDDSDEPVDIPLDVVDFVDQGKNPDECMRVIMSSVLQRAQEAKGKSTVFDILERSYVGK